MAQTAVSEMIPVWRTDAQPWLLHALLYDAGPVTSSAVAQRCGLPRETVSREARRLVTAGIVTQRVVGRNHLLQLVSDHPALAALRTLVDLTVGPLIDLRRLYDASGVVVVYVYGSWARRHLGEPGEPPRDIDVLVVSANPAEDYHSVSTVCLGLSGRYGIGVNPTVITEKAFALPEKGSVLAEIVAGQLVEVRR